MSIWSVNLLDPQSEYTVRSYGDELDRFVKRMNRKIAQERKKGTIKKFSDDLETDLAD